jgi:PAS domain S-box-containing protein
MALEHSNLDGAKPYAGGPDASTDDLRWSELRYRTAEEAVQKSEAILRAVTENTPDWLFLLDETLHVRFMNRPFGPNRPEVVLGQAFLDFVPQELRPNMEEIYRRALATGVPARLELRKPGPDGQPGNFEHRIMPVVEGGAVRSLTVAVTDVTERKRVENELRTQVRILETMQEGVVLVDPASYAICLTNPTFDRMFGYGNAELLGHSIEPLFSMLTVQRRRLARALRDNPKTGEITPVEFECARKDGTRFVAACVVTPLIMNGTEHWLAVLNDVTERKQLEREIIEIANREQQRIGSDLHDGLGQELTGIALMLKGVVTQLRKEGSAAHRDVEEVIGLVNNAIDSTRVLARGLSPVGSGRGNLGAAIQTFWCPRCDSSGLRGAAAFERNRGRARVSHRAGSFDERHAPQWCPGNLDPSEDLGRRIASAGQRRRPGIRSLSGGRSRGPGSENHALSRPDVGWRPGD